MMYTMSAVIWSVITLACAVMVVVYGFDPQWAVLGGLSAMRALDLWERVWN